MRRAGDIVRLRIPEPQVGQPEIGMAPLIDVVFLLIIFFVVTTVFPDRKGMQIEKPVSSQAAALPEIPLTVTLDAQDQAFFNGQAVTMDRLALVLGQELAPDGKRAVLVQADRRATAQGLIRVIDACKAAGIDQVAIATVEPNRVSSP